MHFFDCFFPESMSTAWHRDNGFTEIFFSGGTLRDTEGDVVKKPDDTFIRAIERSLRTWAAGIQNPKKQNCKWFGTMRSVMKGYRLSFRPKYILVQPKIEGAGCSRIKIGRSHQPGATLAFRRQYTQTFDEADPEMEEAEDEGFEDEAEAGAEVDGKDEGDGGGEPGGGSGGGQDGESSHDDDSIFVSQ